MCGNAEAAVQETTGPEWIGSARGNYITHQFHCINADGGARLPQERNHVKQMVRCQIEHFNLTEYVPAMLVPSVQERPAMLG